MDLSGAGAKAAVAVLLYGPLSLEQLIEHSGVSRRALWAGIAQAGRLGLIERQKRGRSTVYVSPLCSILGESGVGYTYPRKGEENNIYTYRGLPGAKTAPQSAIIAPGPDDRVQKLHLIDSSGAKTALQGAKTAPSQPSEPSAEIAPSPLDAVVAADLLPGVLDTDKQRNSRFVKRRVAQREAISALWSDLLPTKPVPARTTLDRLLLEAGNSAYFLAVVLQDMTASGKDIAWPIGYLSKALAGRKQRGDIPVIPAALVGEGDLDEMTPELAATIDRVNGLGAWRSDDD